MGKAEQGMQQLSTVSGVPLHLSPHPSDEGQEGILAPARPRCPLILLGVQGRV